MTVAEWVRQSLREARMARQSDAQAKLRAVDEATRHGFPVGDIETMLGEIEADRLPELPAASSGRSGHLRPR
ncbi:MAG: hypothetical protein OXH09_17110 [Gammaproteobacteria bacterium]|nr:hypothetical protein [Gammaproteobacteria bacterium]